MFSYGFQPPPLPSFPLKIVTWNTLYAHMLPSKNLKKKISFESDMPEKPKSTYVKKYFTGVRKTKTKI